MVLTVAIYYEFEAITTHNLSEVISWCFFFSAHLSQGYIPPRGVLEEEHSSW